MTSSEFAYICKHPEIIAAQCVVPLEEAARVFPYCQSAHILSAKYYEDLDDTSPIAQQKLQIAALYCVDRAMLKSIMDRDPVQVIEARRGVKTTEKVQRAVKGKTSVILTEANPVIAKKRTGKPLSQSNITGYDDVRVPEIILPNEKLLSNSKQEPIAKGTTHIAPSKSDYVPISVSQPYGEALFNELYQNLKELGQRKKKVLGILDKLPSTVKSKVASTKPAPTVPGTNPESKTVPKAVSPAAMPTLEPKLKSDAAKPSAGTRGAKSEKAATRKKNKLSETVAAAPSINTESIAENQEIPIAKKAGKKPAQATKSSESTQKKKTTTKPVKDTKTEELSTPGIEHASFDDEADLLLQYLHTLHPDASEPEVESVKKKEAPNLQEQQKLIDSFLKELPVIKPRETRPAEGELPVQDLSEASTQAPSFVSENLARIYLRQGNKAKAKETYEKLSLKYPDKSSYFAAEIAKLDE